MLPSPKLSFSEPFSIAQGVVVSPIDFINKQKKIPFHTTYFQVASGCQTPVDHHPENEIWIILSGKGILLYEESTYFLSPENIFFFSPFKHHQAINNTDNLLLICSIYW